MEMKLLFLLIFLIVVGCEETEKTAPPETPDAVRVIEVKDAKTLLGKVIYYRDVYDDTVKVVDKKPVYRNWYTEIDIVFSGTPINLQVSDFSIDCEEAERTVPPELANIANIVVIVEVKKELDNFDWEQTANILTLFLTFNIDESQDCVKFYVDLTLDWNTGRKRLQGIPIRPSKEITQIPDVQRTGGLGIRFND